MQKHKVYCLDTNIILDDPSNILKLYDDGNNTIIIPEVVIDELDAKKSGFDDINYNARQFARLLEDSEILEKTFHKDLTIIKTKIESLNVELYIISQENYKCEDSKVAQNILNDRKILEVAKGVHDYHKDKKNKEVVFLSLDIMCRTRALSMGLETETLKGKDQELNYNFHKFIIIETDVKLEGKEVISIDSDYKPENYSYTIECQDTGRQRLFYVFNSRLYEVDEAELERQTVKPINKEQKFFVNSIISGNADIICIDAKAGSGKTLLALSSAMKLVKQKKYSRILYIRNSIESLDKGEDVGYLPGLAEKFAVYNHPLQDSLKYIARTEVKKSKSNTSKGNQDIKELELLITEKVENYIKAFNIETCWVGELRGRTFDNAIVVVDEAQNMSSKTLQLVLSRLDSTCKVIVIGSNKQIDNMYTNKYINGLSTLLKSCKDKHEEVRLFAGELNKVVRGPITEFAERIFSK